MDKKYRIAKEELEKELDAYENRENIEIEKIVVSGDFYDKLLEGGTNEIFVTHSDGRNRFCGFPILYEDGKIKTYEMVTNKLYDFCHECSCRELYDEKSDTYYCPFCDGIKERIRDKVYNLLD
jgi:hypothetical protein